jgi:hypothetical protein
MMLCRKLDFAIKTDQPAIVTQNVILETKSFMRSIEARQLRSSGWPSDLVERPFLVHGQSPMLSACN